MCVHVCVRERRREKPWKIYLKCRVSGPCLLGSGTAGVGWSQGTCIFFHVPPGAHDAGVWWASGMRRLPSCTDPQVQALLSVLGDISFLLSQGDLAFSFFSHVAGSISTVRFGPQCVCVCVCPTLCNPMDYSPHQTPLSMEFSRQEYWSGLPFPSSGHLPDSGIEPTSPASPALSGRFFTTSASWEALSSNEASPDSLWEGHPPPSAHSLLLSFFLLRGRHNVSSYSTRV